MHQGCGLQGVPRPLVPQMPVGDFSQFGIDERDEIVECRLIAASEGMEQNRDGAILSHQAFNRSSFPLAIG